MTKSKPIEIVISGEEMTAKPKVFKSGKKGYGCYGIIKIDGYPYRLSLNLIEIG